MPKVKKPKRSLLSQLTRRPLLTAALVLALLIGGGLIYNQLRDSRYANEPSDSDTQSSDYVNLNPPTEQEKRDAEENKNNLAETPNPPPMTSDGKKQVTPQIISADRSEVRAYVPGVFEDGGTCTATATKAGEAPKTATSKGFKNVSYTQCEPINWSLPSGGWSVIVSYSSTAAKGTSGAFVVN